VLIYSLKPDSQAGADTEGTTNNDYIEVIIMFSKSELLVCFWCFIISLFIISGAILLNTKYYDKLDDIVETHVRCGYDGYVLMHNRNCHK